MDIIKSQGGRGTAGGLPAAVGKYVFTASLVGLAFLSTSAATEVEITEGELADIVLRGAMVHTVLVAGAFAVFRVRTLSLILARLGYRSRGGGLTGAACARILNVVLALVVVLEITSVYTFYTEMYLTGSRALVLLLSVVTGTGIFAALQFIDEIRWVKLALPLVLLSVLVFLVALHLRPPEVEWEYTSQVRSVSFEETPNLYFVAFDALSPQTVLEEYFDIDTTYFIELFEAEFRRFPNLFVDVIWSRNSLNTIMALDPEIYWSAYEQTGFPGPSFLLGEFPSPLGDILRDNGYETNLVFYHSIYGRDNGPYLDHFETMPSTICDLIDPSIVDLVFWGYCSLFPPVPGLRPYLQPQIEDIERVAKRSEPQFLLSYTKFPRHAHPTYNHSDPRDREAFRAEYIEKSTLAAIHTAQIVDILREHDPDALLFVFGDHGTWLSRSLEFSDDPEFVVKDSYAVLGGIWPPDACEPWFDETLEQEFLTLLDAVHTILRCLSGGEEALVEPRDRLLRAGLGPSQRLPDDGVERSYADYLYE